VTAIGFVGLGTMGARMARRLIDAGHDLTVWNRTASKSAPLAAAGAHVAATPADAARSSEIVVTMVRDASALAAVTGGDDGVLAGLAPGSLLIDMSTVGPDAVHELAASLPHATALVDAPVLGSVEEARDGRLRIFVGADADAFARVQPLLLALGEPLRVGALGAGAAAKLVANSTLFAILTALGEAVALGDALRLSRESVFQVLAATPLAAQAERRQPAIESHEYPPRFALRLAHKDAALVVDAAARRGLDLRSARAACAWLGAADGGGWGGRDYSAILAWIVERRHPGAT
jgi:3-hydroxyisobutyrate dehydrogenase-like beta-hydroxyacid dehydrogenase